jgi:hypothetical protein
MVMKHLRALVDIAKQLADGPARKAVLSVVDSFIELSKGFKFTDEPPEGEDSVTSESDGTSITPGQ